MEVYLTQGALLHHTCNARRRCCVGAIAAAALCGAPRGRARPRNRACPPGARHGARSPPWALPPRRRLAAGPAARHGALPDRRSPRRSASSVAACCWAGRSPRRPTGPALTTARAALSRPRQDLEADPALRGSIRMGTRGRRAAQIGDAQGVDLHGHVSNELGQPAVRRVERQGAGTLIATDDLPCMHWRVERQGAGTLIATDDLPCMHWRVERQGAGTLIATDDLPCMHWRVERQGAGTLIATDDLPCMHWRSPQRSRPAPVRSS